MPIKSICENCGNLLVIVDFPVVLSDYELVCEIEGNKSYMKWDSVPNIKCPYFLEHQLAMQKGKLK